MGTGGVEKHWPGRFYDPRQKLRVDSETGAAGLSCVTTKNNSSLSITANLLIHPPPLHVSVLITRRGSTINSPSQTFTVLRVLVCENLIVYCADRIRCFPGKRHSQEAKYFIWEHAQERAHGVGDSVHAGN